MISSKLIFTYSCPQTVWPDLSTYLHSELSKEYFLLILIVKIIFPVKGHIYKQLRKVFNAMLSLATINKNIASQYILEIANTVHAFVLGVPSQFLSSIPTDVCQLQVLTQNNRIYVTQVVSLFFPSLCYHCSFLCKPRNMSYTTGAEDITCTQIRQTQIIINCYKLTLKQRYAAESKYVKSQLYD